MHDAGKHTQIKQGMLQPSEWTEGITYMGVQWAASPGGVGIQIVRAAFPSGGRRWGREGCT